jgi:hypothetical protein
MTVQAAEIGQNQIGEIVAVAPFKAIDGGDAELSDGFPKPLKILGFQRFLRQRITRVGVKAGGDNEHVGFAAAQLFQCAFQYFAILNARSGRCDREIETVLPDVLFAGAGIAGILVN